MYSYPTARRRLVASGIMVSGFILTVVVKLIRNHTEIGLPMRLMDSMPNVVCGAVVPFAVFIGNRAIRMFEFLAFCGFIVLGLSAYEIVQVWLPKRTFQLNDIVASVVGGVLSMLLGWLFFRRNA
ncbi:MAG: hypothetical protein JNL58_00365 [Planctomyces sp.]|nr:hypothetical protein [Planctomyces sp.]